MKRTGRMQTTTWVALAVIAFLCVVAMGARDARVYAVYGMMAAGAGLVFLLRRWTVQEAGVYLLFPLLLLYQLYVPVIGNVDVPLFYLFLCGLFAISLFSLRAFGWMGQKVLLLYGFFYAALLVGLPAAQDMYLGVQTMMYLTTGLLALGAGFYVREKGMDAERLLTWLLLLGLPAAWLNVLFFLSPDLELAYLRSRLAQLFIQPDQVTGLFGSLRNNVLDPNKAGTLFVNTNIASIFYLMLFWLAASFLLNRKKKRDLVFAGSYFLAFLATYSRAGLLAFVVTVAVIAVVNLDRLRFWKKGLWFVIPGCIIIIGGWIGGFFTRMLERLQAATVMDDPRFLIWRFAWDAFQQAPLLGLGFGGWEASFPGYAFGVSLKPDFPPHNMFIHAWSWGGLAAVLFLGALLTYILAKGWLLYRSGHVLALALVAAVVTVLVQGMFENFFLTDYRIAGLFFFMAGMFLYQVRRGKSNEHVGGES